MFRTLSYKWANSLFGFIAMAMIPIPYVCRGSNSNYQTFADEVLYMVGTVFLRTSNSQKEQILSHGYGEIRL
jgi:hypothetical protein